MIANPPFSLKNWGSDKWSNDPFGRNFAGLPPKKNGDMAWVQHMIKSLNKKGCMAVVLPQGVCLEKEKKKIRKKLIKSDLIEAVIGLGPNIFYGTQLAPCILILKKIKKKIILEKFY